MTSLYMYYGLSFVLVEHSVCHEPIFALINVCIYICMYIYIYVYLCVYVSLKIKDSFRLMRPMLEHSVTHNATIPKDLLKRI